MVSKDVTMNTTTTTDIDKLIRTLEEIRDVLKEINKTLQMTDKQKVTKSKLPFFEVIRHW